jgi:hypothetical protein
MTARAPRRNSQAAPEKYVMFIANLQSVRPKPVQEPPCTVLNYIASPTLCAECHNM